MSVSDLRATRNKRRIQLTLTIVLLGATPLHAAAPVDDTAVAPPRSSVNRPEFQPGHLSDDLPKPSKDISDDYPIDLPVDI